MADPAQPPVNPVNYNVDGQNVPIHNPQAVQVRMEASTRRLNKQKCLNSGGRRKKTPLLPMNLSKELTTCLGPQGLCQHLVGISSNAWGYHWWPQSLDHQSTIVQSGICKQIQWLAYLGWVGSLGLETGGECGLLQPLEQNQHKGCQ